MDDSQLDLSLPHIDYSNSLYIGIRISQSAPSHLQLVQNEAVPGKDTISPLSWHILTGYQWSTGLNLRFFYLFLKHWMDWQLATFQSCSSLLHPLTLRTADPLLLSISCTQLKTKGGWVFSFVGPNLWNSSSQTVKSAPSMDTFKHAY